VIFLQALNGVLGLLQSWDGFFEGNLASSSELFSLIFLDVCLGLFFVGLGLFLLSIS
jgi:hypothetical protein